MLRATNLFVSALLLAANPAWAQQWVLVVKSEQASFYVDPSTLWIDGRFRSISELTNNALPDRGAMSFLSVIEYDCAEKRTRLIRGEFFPEKWAKGRGFGSSTAPSPWFYVGGPGATIQQYVCKSRPE